MLTVFKRHKFCNVTWFKQLLFHFFNYLFICRSQRKIKLVTLSWSYLYIFFKVFFSLLSIFLSYLSLLLNLSKASEIIFKTQFLKKILRKEYIALHITIFVQQNLYNNNCTHNTSCSWRNMEQRTSLTSLILIEVFAEITEVNTEALNIKSCQPRQKHYRGKAEAKCFSYS